MSFHERCGEGRTRAEIECHRRNGERTEWAIFCAVMLLMLAAFFALLAVS